MVKSSPCLVHGAGDISGRGQAPSQEPLEIPCPGWRSGLSDVYKAKWVRLPNQCNEIIELVLIGCAVRCSSIAACSLFLASLLPSNLMHRSLRGGSSPSPCFAPANLAPAGPAAGGRQRRILDHHMYESKVVVVNGSWRS